MVVHAQRLLPECLSSIVVTQLVKRSRSEYASMDSHWVRPGRGRCKLKSPDSGPPVTDGHRANATVIQAANRYLCAPMVPPCTPSVPSKVMGVVGVGMDDRRSGRSTQLLIDTARFNAFGPTPTA